MAWVLFVWVANRPVGDDQPRRPNGPEAVIRKSMLARRSVLGQYSRSAIGSGDSVSDRRTFMSTLAISVGIHAQLKARLGGRALQPSLSLFRHAHDGSLHDGKPERGGLSGLNHDELVPPWKDEDGAGDLHLSKRALAGGELPSSHRHRSCAHAVS
jgi:hypothetical protein